MMLVRTFLDTKLAVGRLGTILPYGRVRPTVSQTAIFSTAFFQMSHSKHSRDSLATAIGMMMNKSM